MATTTAATPAAPTGAMRWALIVGVQCLLAALLLVDVRLPFFLLVAAAATLFAYAWPVWTVYIVLAARVVTTTATSFRVGPVSLGLFEPSFALAYLVYLLRATVERRSILRSTPVTLPIVTFTAYCVLSTFWSPDVGDSIHETVIAVIFTFGFILVSSAIREARQFEQALWIYVTVTCGYGILGMVLGTSDSTIYSDVQFKIMEGGGRTGGLGQQPNWFAMNLAFAVNPGFALAFVQRDWWKRWLLMGLTLTTIFAMITSGSRGGTWSVGIGILWVSLFNPRIRRFFVKYWLAGAMVFAIFMTFSIGNYSSAFTRIATQGIGTIIEGDVRISNWLACIQMAKETWGFGIGPGGYEVFIEHINAKIADSDQKYPHGIIWGLIAHQGVFGVLFFIVLVQRTFHHFYKAWSGVRGTRLEYYLLGASAAIIGYHCHGLIEFEIHDKPFWEFFGLFWALILISQRAAADPQALEALRLVPKARRGAARGRTVAAVPR